MITIAIHAANFLSFSEIQMSTLIFRYFSKIVSDTPKTLQVAYLDQNTLSQSFRLSWHHGNQLIETVHFYKSQKLSSKLTIFGPQTTLVFGRICRFKIFHLKFDLKREERYKIVVWV